MSSKYKYKVWCETEQLWVESEEWSSGKPVLCFNDNAHTITQNFTTLIDFKLTEEIHIKEEKISTNGNFRNKGYEFTCPTGTSAHDISFPIPVNIISVEYTILSDNIDDCINVIGGPETTAGFITSNVSSSDTVINVSNTVTANAQTGTNIKLTDGTNTDDLGIIIDVDQDAGTVTVETATTNSFLAATPTYVQLSSYIVSGVKLKTLGVYKMADDKTEKNHLEANKIIRVEYVNAGSECIFHFYLSYMN